MQKEIKNISLLNGPDGALVSGSICKEMPCTNFAVGYCASCDSGSDGTESPRCSNTIAGGGGVPSSGIAGSLCWVAWVNAQVLCVISVVSGDFSVRPWFKDKNVSLFDISGTCSTTASWVCANTLCGDLSADSNCSRLVGLIFNSQKDGESVTESAGIGVIVASNLNCRSVRACLTCCHSVGSSWCLDNWGFWVSGPLNVNNDCPWGDIETLFALSSANCSLVLSPPIVYRLSWFFGGIRLTN